MVAVVAVVVVVVLALWVIAPLAGVSPLGNPLGLGSKPSSPGGAEDTYDQAAGYANSFVATISGGGWGLELAAGISLSQTFVLTDGDTCDPAAGFPTNGGSPGTGTAPLWELEYAKVWSSNDTTEYLAVLVEGSVVTMLPHSCGGGLGETTFSTAGIMDSSVADTDANADGGSSYLQGHLNASVVYLLIPGANSGLGTDGPVWEIEYSVCPLGTSATGVKGSYPESVWALNATSGSLLRSATVTESCSTSTPATIAVGMSPVSVSTCGPSPGADEYAISVASTSGSLTTDMFGAELAEPSGADTSLALASGVGTTSCGLAPPAADDWEMYLVSPTGVDLAYYDAEGWVGWNSSTPVTIGSGDTFVVLVASSLSSSADTLALYGTGGYSVTGSVTL